jgi:L-alanine-DL-glutamate epimerase-like enolase superfamily enzyme
LYGNPFWIEDTVPINDWESQRIVTQKFPQIMFAAGEDALNIKQIMNIATSGTYDVIMPDVKYMGGPSAVKSIIPSSKR